MELLKEVNLVVSLNTPREKTEVPLNTKTPPPPHNHKKLVHENTLQCFLDEIHLRSILLGERLSQSFLDDLHL